MSAREVLEESLPSIDSFIAEVEAAEDDKERELRLSHVRGLVKVLAAFFTAFLAESLEVQVRGFSYKDKRKVSQRLVKIEMGSSQSELGVRALELAARFEDLSDLFHGDVDFGYADDPDAYKAFHEEAFPDWLDAVGKWLRAEGRRDVALADSLDEVSKRYTHAIG